MSPKKYFSMSVVSIPVDLRSVKILLDETHSGALLAEGFSRMDDAPRIGEGFGLQFQIVQLVLAWSHEFLLIPLRNVMMIPVLV